MKGLLISCVLAIPSFLFAQTIDFAATVSFDYSGETLQTVLEDLSNRYGVQFSYSRQLVPLDHSIIAKGEEVSFEEALDIVFESTHVIYGFIGQQIVLSIDEKASLEPLLGDVGDEQDDDSMTANNDTYSYGPRDLYAIPVISSHTVNQISQTSPRDHHRFTQAYLDRDRLQLLQRAERDQSTVQLQATLVPSLQVKSRSASDQPINFSFNLLWGVNSGIEGIELGGLGNILQGHMYGFQAAGLFNVIGGSLRGFQASGLVNVAREASEGLQLSGLGNHASAGGQYLVQAGGLYNMARGDVAAQVAGLVNVGDVVKGAQIAGLVNVANRVDGLQLGLINVSDTATIPIGLFSVVRSGYHAVELAGEDVVHGNFNIRMGVRSFYNILHIGATGGVDSWSLGYGIGTSLRIGRTNYLQLEALSRHVNEDETWTNELNLMNQFKLNFDLRLGNHLRVAVGPSFNVFVSHLYDAENDRYGTKLSNYTIFDKTYFRSGRNPVNVQGWIGVHAGIRLSN